LTDKIEPIKIIPSRIEIELESRNRESKPNNDFRKKIQEKMEERLKKLRETKTKE